MDLNTLIEYIRIHKTSMEQDLEAMEASGRWDNNRILIQGAIAVSNHYLEVINE